MRDLSKTFAPIVFEVTHIHIVSRPTHDGVMNVVHSIALGEDTAQPYPSPLDVFPFRRGPLRNASRRIIGIHVPPEETKRHGFAFSYSRFPMLLQSAPHKTVIG